MVRSGDSVERSLGMKKRGTLRVGSAVVNPRLAQRKGEPGAPNVRGNVDVTKAQPNQLATPPLTTSRAMDRANIRKANLR